MPGISRKGDGLSTGHICATTSTLATPGQGSVFANGKLVARKGDPTVAHPFPPSPACAPHTAAVKGGSGSVFCNGSAVARIGDAADLGSMTGGSGNVSAG
jgi:uncharacterized Zn-binding protein involved in type VI secretion|tara:strand:- start:231 stop:530 length:300 start_codon:yes stop_codon:yes gene_type:complete